MGSHHSTAIRCGGEGGGRLCSMVSAPLLDLFKGGGGMRDEKGGFFLRTNFFKLGGFLGGCRCSRKSGIDPRAKIPRFSP